MRPNDVYTCLEESLRFVVSKPRPAMLKVLEEFAKYLVEKPRSGKIFAIDLPTGYGKSTLSIALARAVKTCLDIAERVIHVVPTRSLVRDLVMRARAKGVEAYGQYTGIEQSLKSPFFLMDLVFTTIDSYALNLFKIPVAESKYLLELYVKGEDPLGHFEVPRYAIYTGINVFDEYHLIVMPTRFDSSSIFKPITTFTVILDTLSTYAISTIIETATHVRSFIELLERYGIRVTYIPFDPSMDQEFVESRRGQRIYTYMIYTDGEKIVEDIITKVTDMLSRGFRKVCVVMNTIERALKVYEALQQYCGNDVVLLHSRFRHIDLDEKLHRIEENARVVVATQVIEVGLDLDFDAIIAELAPLPSLVQRIGRVCRDPKRKCHAEVSVVVDVNELEKEFYTVYDALLTRKTLEVLKGVSTKSSDKVASISIDWKLPFSYNGVKSYAELVERIYGEIDLGKYIDRKIRMHLENIAKRYVHTSKDAMEALTRMSGSFIRDEVLISVYLAPSCKEGLSLDDVDINVAAIPLYAILTRNNTEIRSDLLCVDGDKVLAVLSRDRAKVVKWAPTQNIIKAFKKGLPFIDGIYMIEYLVGRRDRYDKRRGFV